MATIEKRSEKYRVQIRKKGKFLTATFTSLEMAEIWSRYQEELLDNMENFDIEPEKLITLEQCVELKIKSLDKEKITKKTLQEYQNLISEFKDIMDCPLRDITCEMIKKISNNMLNSMVRRGGSSNFNTGKFQPCSPHTALRKLRYLSAVFSYMIEKGANITNVAQIICNNVKMSFIKNGSKIELDNFDETEN